MAGPEFFQTRMGQKFFEATAPRIAVALEDIAKEMKRANDLKEKERQEKEAAVENEMAEDLAYMEAIAKRYKGES